jgi:hypothetical protein
MHWAYNCVHPSCCTLLCLAGKGQWYPDTFSLLLQLQFAEFADSKGGQAMLTPQQQQWLTIQRMLASTQFEACKKAPPSFIGHLVFEVVTSSWFEWLVLGLIIGNMIILALSHAGMDEAWVDATSYANLVFTGLFAVEAVMKITAFGPHQYFRVSLGEHER